MRALAVVASLLLVGLAGCSSTPESPDLGAASSSSSPSVLVFEEQVRLTDTLHLLEAPHMAGEVPPSGDPLRQQVPTRYSQPIGGSRPIEWSMPRPDLAALTGEVVVWVDVQGTVVNQGYAGLAGCFWLLWVAIVDDAGTETEIGSCLVDSPVVPTGLRQLRWDIPTYDAFKQATGTRVVFGLETTAAPGTGGTVMLLSGTEETDSVVQIDGLQVPVDTMTLLL